MNVPRLFKTSVLLLALCLNLMISEKSYALFGPKPGDICKTTSEKKVISGKKYICELSSDNKYRWLTNEKPTDEQIALSLVMYSCGDFYDSKFIVNMYPRKMFGALVELGINDGQYKPAESSMSMINYDIGISSAISKNLEMAAALDSKWSRINQLWIQGIDNSYKRWLQGGVNQIESINLAKNNLDAIESICKVAKIRAESQNQKEKRILVNWLKRVASYGN